MDLEKLEQIGLTKGEIKVYNALLELGESTKTPIVRASGISAGKIYDVLDRLIKKGLVSTIKKGNVIHFRVANPKNLKVFLEKKKIEIENEEKIVDKLLPSLLLKYTTTEAESDAEVYKGWKGVETVYNQIIGTLEKGDFDLVFGATKGKDPERTKLFFTRFNKNRYKKGINLKIIYNDGDRVFAYEYLTNKKLDQIKFLSLQTPTEINIYKDKVIILILTKTPLAIVITSDETANSFREYFNLLWKQAKH